MRRPGFIASQFDRDRARQEQQESAATRLRLRAEIRAELVQRHAEQLAHPSALVRGLARLGVNLAMLIDLARRMAAQDPGHKLYLHT